jgi:hypothetical protein
MEPRIRQLLDEAKIARSAKGPGAALDAYRIAAREARSSGETLGLAHALRHVADLARELGEVVEAHRSASEAVAIYRPLGEPHAPDLANALRVLALAQEAKLEDATETWREARDLYRACGIDAGVAECDAHLPS